MSMPCCSMPGVRVSWRHRSSVAPGLAGGYRAAVALVAGRRHQCRVGARAAEPGSSAWSRCLEPTGNSPWPQGSQPGRSPCEGRAGATPLVIKNARFHHGPLVSCLHAGRIAGSGPSHPELRTGSGGSGGLQAWSHAAVRAGSHDDSAAADQSAEQRITSDTIAKGMVEQTIDGLRRFDLTGSASCRARRTGNWWGKWIPAATGLAQTT